MKEIREIRLEDITIGEYEQRVNYEDDDIDSLASSIRRLGLIYPIVVSEIDGKFTLLEGHRRLLAHKKLGWHVIVCSISEPRSAGYKEIAFAGNFFRKDLSQIELAAAISDAHKRDGMSIEDLAAGFHKKEEWVRRMIAILAWPKDVQQCVHERLLSVSAASNLAQIPDATYREFLIKNAAVGGATARTTASWLQAWQSMEPVEDAVVAEPVGGVVPVSPAVPQAPCFCCVQSFPVDQVSHVPVCSACVQILRKVGEV